MEEWKVINGLDCYQISSLGNVKSFAKGNEKILKPRKRYDGYLFFALTNKEKKVFSRYAHRLVAEAFIENPENKKEVNHINGIRNDNRVENLSWVTPKENIQESINNGRWKSRMVSVVQKSKDGDFIKRYNSIAEAGRETGIIEDSIRSALRSKNKITGGFLWSA